MRNNRRGRPSLIGTAARTAVVTKTATSVAGNSAAKQQAQMAQAQHVAASASPAPASGGMTQDVLDKLKQLGELKSAGILTDAEFEAQKARLLA